jgi:hypothetical protein
MDAIAKIRVVTILLDTGHVDLETALKPQDDGHQDTIDKGLTIARTMGWLTQGYPDAWHASVATALAVIHTYVTGEGQIVGGTGLKGDEDPYRPRIFQ